MFVYFRAALFKNSSIFETRAFEFHFKVKESLVISREETHVKLK